MCEWEESVCRSRSDVKSLDLVPWPARWSSLFCFMDTDLVFHQVEANYFSPGKGPYVYFESLAPSFAFGNSD